MVFRELLRLPDSIANQSFCRSDISRVQLRSNWTIVKRLLASDQSKFDNAGQFYLKDNEILYST